MIDDLLNQLRNNSRLRWRVMLIAGLCWLYAVLLLRDNLLEQQQQHRLTAQYVSRLGTQLAQPEWLNRIAPTKTLAVQLEGRLWQAPTSGLAQAAFQEWLNSAMLKAGVTRPQVTVTLIEEVAGSAPDQTQPADRSAPADLWKVNAKLGFDFNAAALLNFMKQVESHDKQITVAALKANKEPVNRVEMELLAYFQKQAAPATPPRKELVPF